MKIGIEHPECRDVINNLISLSRENQRQVLKRLEMQEAQPVESKNNLVTEEMLKFAERFYKARQAMGLPQWECGKKAGVASRTIALIERTSIDGEYVPFYMHVKNISKRDLARDSMFKLGVFLSIPKDELEDW